MANKDFNVRDAVYCIMDCLENNYEEDNYCEETVKVSFNNKIVLSGSMRTCGKEKVALIKAKQWVFYKGMYECIAETETLVDIWRTSDAESIANKIVNSLDWDNSERIDRLQKYSEQMLAKFGPDSHK